jgi:site-specific recombinase XerD
MPRTSGKKISERRPSERSTIPRPAAIADATPRIDEAMVDAFLGAMHGANPNTRSAYRAALSLAASLAIPIDVDVLKSFSAQLARRKYAKATQQLYLAGLRRLLEWLDANDRLPANLNRAKAEARFKVARGKTRGGYRHRIADERIPMLVQFFDGPPPPIDAQKSAGSQRARLEHLRSRAILHTLYASAGRVSEVAGLTRGQVADGAAAEVLILGKGAKERMLFLTPEAQAAIRAYCRERSDSSPALFISHGRGAGQQLSRVAIWQTVKRVARALELNANTSPHSFRHYRATQLLNEGMPLESVQAYLGHTSPATTRIVYAHTKTDVLKDQLATFGLSPKEAARNVP